MANVNRCVTLGVAAVTLSAAKGLLPERRCFAALSMTRSHHVPVRANCIGFTVMCSTFPVPTSVAWSASAAAQKRSA